MADSNPPATKSEFSPWAAFSHADFFFLWSSGVAMTVSMLLRTLISTQWLYDTTGSEAQLGMLGVVQFLQLPMALYGGSLADRMDRKKLMVLTQLFGTGLLAFLTILAASDSLKPWHIFAVTGLSSMTNTLGSSARPAMLPRVVSRNLLMHAVTILNVTGQLATVVGPILFWPLYDNLGITLSFGISTIISVLSVIFPMLIKASGKPDLSVAQNTWKSFKEGAIFVAKHPLLPGIFFLDFAVTVVSFYRQLYPIFADQLYGMGAEGTGLLNSATAVGGIIGTLAVFYLGRFPRKGVIVLAATLLYAVFLIAFGVNRNFPIGLFIVGVLGMADSMTVTVRQAIVQLATPDELIGRAASIRTFAALSANNLGQVEVGVMSGIIGAGPTMLIGGFISVLLVVVVWRFVPGIRNYRYDNKSP